MTQEEILQYNKMCAEFLSKESKVYSDTPTLTHYRFNNSMLLTKDMKFHTDWNWIMEVVEAIEKTYDEFHGYFGVFISSNGCTIQGTKLRTNPENPHYAYFNDVTHDTKREAVVEAINQFLIWYNENNKQWHKLNQ